VPGRSSFQAEDRVEQAQDEAPHDTIRCARSRSFGEPIGALVDECKMAPKETLWQKLKKLL